MVPFEKVKIGKQGSVTHSHALLDVLHLDRTFLQCERHKDRELSLVLDLKPWSGGEPDGVTHSLICTSCKALQAGSR